MLTATSGDAPLPAGHRAPLQQFAELVAAALAQQPGARRAAGAGGRAERAATHRGARPRRRRRRRRCSRRSRSRRPGWRASSSAWSCASPPDGSTEIVALDGAPGELQTRDARARAATAPSIASGARGRAARIDDLAAMSGRWPRMASASRLLHERWRPDPPPTASCGGRSSSRAASRCRRRSSRHLADFAELVSTAISAAQTRAELRVLADEQAALRRVAELVARGAVARRGVRCGRHRGVQAARRPRGGAAALTTG